VPARAKAYLIQDLEHLFNPAGDGFQMGVNSYKFGFTPICLGRWLAQQVSRLSLKRVYSLPFGADLDIYHPRNDTPRRKQVCGIYQPEKPRRCGRMLIESLGIFKHRHPEYEVVLYGNQQPAHTWFPIHDLGIRPPQELARLYAESEAGVCLSTTNPSRIPFEMLACGLPVVDIYQENNLYDLPEKGLTLAEPSPESIAEALASVVHDSASTQRISYEVSTDVEVASFVSAVQAILGRSDGSPNSGIAPDSAVMEVLPDTVIRRCYRKTAVVSNVYDCYDGNSFRGAVVALDHALDARERSAVHVLTPPRAVSAASEPVPPAVPLAFADLTRARVISSLDDGELPSWVVEHKTNYLQIHPVPGRIVGVVLSPMVSSTRNEARFARAVVEYGHYCDDSSNADPAWFRFGFTSRDDIDDRILDAMELPTSDIRWNDPATSVTEASAADANLALSDWIRLSPGQRSVTLFDRSERPFSQLLILTAVAPGLSASYSWAGVSAVRCVPELPDNPEGGLRSGEGKATPAPSASDSRGRRGVPR